MSKELAKTGNKEINVSNALVLAASYSKDSKVIDLPVKTCLDVNGETDDVMPPLIVATKWKPNR